MKLTPEQESAINTYGQDILVSASAGSGKTSTMMAKIGQMVTGNAEQLNNEVVDVKNLMIVTFTKAVAKELKEKVIKALLEEIKKAPESGYEKLKSQIENLPLANISTLHAMCSSILRQHFNEADIDPSFSVIEDTDAAVLLNRALQNVKSKKILENNSVYITIAGYFGNNFDSDIKNTYNNIRSMENYKEFLHDGSADFYSGDFKESKLFKDYFDRTINNFKKIAQRLIDIGIELGKIDVESFAVTIEFLNNVAFNMKLIANSKDSFELMNNIQSYVDSVGSFKSKSKLDPQLKIHSDAAKAYNAFVKGYAKDVLDIITLDTSTLKDDGELLKEYLSIVNDLDDEYARLKKEENVLDFSDLEHTMLKLLSNADALEELRNSISYLFVDEYQDINPIQEVILRKLSMNKNNLFMVGDVKQSIYGFRLADPTIFINKFKKFTEDTSIGKAISFNKNFRSRREILDFANSIFNVIMTDDFGGVDYEHTAQLTTEKKDVDPNNRFIKIALVNKEEKEEKEYLIPNDGVYSVKGDVGNDVCHKLSKEGLYIAKEIKKLVGKVYFDKKPLEYKDIAIIGRKKSLVLNVAETLLECKIPVDISDVAKSEENEDIELLITLLSLIDNQNQDVDLATIMVSPFGGFTLSELAEIKSNAGEVDYFHQALNKYKRDDEIKKKLDTFTEMIRRYNFMSKFTSVDKLLEIIINENSFDEYVLSKEDGAKSLSQIRVFINSLRGKTYSSALSRFLSLYREYPGIDGSESASQAEAGSVHAMTIHASKGLEYPVVFVVGMESSFNKDSNGQNIYINKNYGVGIKHADPKTRTTDRSVVTELLVKDKNRTLSEEEMRLLYVALTRAKEYLYLTGTVKDRTLFGTKGHDIEEANSFLDWLEEVAFRNSNFKAAFVDENAEDGLDEVLNKVNGDSNVKFNIEEDSDVLKNMLSYMDNKYKYNNSTISPISYAVTSLNKQSYQEEEEQKVSKEFIKRFSSKTSKTAKEGTAYHKVMELINFDCYSVEDVKDQMDAMVEEGELTAEQRSLVKPEDIFGCLQSDLMKKVNKNTVLQEQPFKIFVKANEVMDTDIEDKVMIQGIIDMFIPKSEINPENILVDFKYTNETEEEIKQTYKKQIELYTKALEISLGEKVDRKYIFVLGINKVVEF